MDFRKTLVMDYYTGSEPVFTDTDDGSPVERYRMPNPKALQPISRQGKDETPPIGRSGSLPRANETLIRSFVHCVAGAPGLCATRSAGFPHAGTEPSTEKTVYSRECIKTAPRAGKTGTPVTRGRDVVTDLRSINKKEGTARKVHPYSAMGLRT
jgi:hypothetical protein